MILYLNVDDLYVNESLDLYAVLGGEKHNRYLIGKERSKIEGQTRNKTELKVRLKEGFPIYTKDGHFDRSLYPYNVQVPTGLNEEQKNFFKTSQLSIKEMISIVTELIIIQNIAVAHVRTNLLICC